jgi:outer membrane protein assembly factor BamA
MIQMKKALIVAAFLLFRVMCACAQEDSESPTQIPPQAEAAQEEPKPAATEEQASLITAIEVRGNKAISTNSIVSKMKTRVGSPGFL